MSHSPKHPGALAGPDDFREMRSGARSLAKTYHPDTTSDVLKGVSEEVRGAYDQLSKLLSQALTAKSAGEWPDGFHSTYKPGSDLLLVGANENGEPHPPKRIRLPKSPGKFVRILSVYVKDGDVPEELLRQEPSAKGRRGDKKPRWQEEEEETAEMLKARARTAETLDALSNLIQAMNLYPQGNMAALGVGAAIDEAAKHLSRRLLESGDSVESLASLSLSVTSFEFSDRGFKDGLLTSIDEKAVALFKTRVASKQKNEDPAVLLEQITSFPFSNEALREELQTVATTLAQETQEAEAPVWRPHRVEAEIVKAKNLLGIAVALQQLGADASLEGHERASMLRVADSRARQLVAKMLRRAESISSVVSIYQQALAFPFSEPEVGFDTLNMVETRAGILFSREIAAAVAKEELVALREAVNKFTFRSEGILARLLSAIASALAR